MQTDTDPTLNAALELRELGFAIHWLHRKQKRPKGDDWQIAPVKNAAALASTYVYKDNVGVRLGEPSLLTDGTYLHVLDVDIRIPELHEEAVAALEALLPGVYSTLPMVKSGSGGSSFHLYFTSDKPFRSKRLAVSEGKHRDSEGRWHYDWEVELFGTGKQVVVPPSIHPITGNPYHWVREFEPFALQFGGNYLVPSETLARLAVVEHSDYEYEAVAPLDFKPGQLERILDDVPVSELHYDDWIRLGQAIHHQLGGSKEGFELWLHYTKQSAKFVGDKQIREMRRSKWPSFGRYRGRPVTMATVVQWAQEARIDALADEFDELEDLDDDSDQREDGTDFGGLFDDDAGECSPDTGDSVAAESKFDDSGASDPDAPIKWASLLDYTEEGAIKGTLHNITLIVENDPRTKSIIRKNVFAEKLVQAAAPGTKSTRKKAAKPTLQLVGEIWKLRDPINGDPWNDSKDALLRRVIEAPKTQGGYGLKVSDRDLVSAIEIVGSNNAFHPVRDYLRTLKWDGKPRMDKLFIDYVKTPDNAYYRAIARLTLVAGVVRVFEPGHKFDFAPILEGLQGRRKSTFIKILGKHWSAELDGDFADDRSMIEKMLGNWVMEIPELSAFGKAEVNHIKAFMSRQEDRARLAYDRRVTIFQRQCIFLGSTNDKKYLKDETGGRRFWPVECTLGPEEEIDTDTLDENIDQLWAEAYLEYLAMREKQPRGTLPLYLRDKDAVRISTLLQESRRVENNTDTMKGIIQEWLDKPEHTGNISDPAEGKPRSMTCAMEIWVECFGGTKKDFPYQQQTAINKALRTLNGWAESGQKRFTKGYGVQKAYVRVMEVQDEELSV